MRFAQRAAALGLAALALLGGRPAAAQESMFSLQFLGVSEETGDVRSRGMGQLGVAVADPQSAITLNPAGLASLERMTLSIMGLAGTRTSRDAFGEDSRGLARFPHQRVALPVPGKLVLSAGFLGLRNFRSEFALPRQAIGTLGYQRTFERSGTLYVVPIGLARRFGPRLQVGLTIDALLGTVDDSWVTGGDSLLSLRTRRRDSFRATTVTLGVAASPWRRLHVGITASPAFDADRSTRTTVSDARLLTGDSSLRSRNVKTDVRMPATLRAGASFEVGKQWRLGADFQRRDWSDYTGRLYGAEGLGLESRLGGGIEFKPGRPSWWGRPAYRAGVSRTTWPQRLGAQPLRETVLHLGTGLDFKGGSGRLDAGFEYARTGSLDRNGREETSWRFLLGLSGQEVWRRKSPRR